MNYDAESQFSYRPKSVIKSAALMGGFSMETPADNFYYGASIEMLARNLQIIGGGSAILETRLGPPFGACSATNCPPNGANTGATQLKHFNFGGFIGVTFNLTGFIQSLF